MKAGVTSRGSADAEVDHLDPALARLGAPGVESRERILLELREHRRKLRLARSYAGGMFWLIRKKLFGS